MFASERILANCRWMAVIPAVAFATLLVLASVAANAADEVEAGRRIYHEGVLPSGAQLIGMRFDQTRVAGAEAACVSCHRPSGMGAVEGNFIVPPINGTYLFNLSQKARANVDPHVGKLLNQAHPPYTDQSLAMTIRTGVNNNGKQMSVAMPHFEIADADMQVLMAYLKQLSRQWSPGVTAERIRFATVVTPGIDGARRKVFLDMMRTAFTQKNGSTLQGVRHMVSPAEMLLRTERKWDLDVWELAGSPDTWGAQLDEYYRKQPVFAVVSGLSSGVWQPVHEFCESQRVPCWFPSVDLPSANTSGGYSLYFSRGVLLEAAVLAAHLTAGGAHTPQRVVQVFRDDAVGRAAALAFKRALQGASTVVVDRPLGDGAESLRDAVRSINTTDVAVLWLPASEFKALSELPPPVAAGIYFSGRLAGGESAIPLAWKNTARLVYPYEIPDLRQHNLDYLHAWLKSRNLPLLDEPMQSEVYFALTFLTDTLADMLDNIYRDYLVERAESMIGRREAIRAEEEARDRPNLGYRGPYAGNRSVSPGLAQAGKAAAPVAIGESQSTTIYPRLTLAQGQRYASKGAYIVRFGGSSGDALVADSDWIVP